MKKIFSLIAVILSAALIFVGCSSKTEKKEDSSSKSDLKIGVVTDEGGAKDKSFNQSNVEAVKAWVDKNGGKALNPIETKNQSDIAANLQNAAKAADVISLAGFYFEKELPKVAESFADKKFIFIDGTVDNKNVESITFAEHEAGYLAGYAAALQSKTGKVGFIGGAKIPAVVKFGVGFVQGAKAANKDIKIVYNYSGSFNDTNKGKTLAATMYDAGADVIFVAAGGTGSGSIKEAQERATKDLKESGEIKHWIVGVDKDQYSEGVFKAKDKDGKDVEKSVILTSAVKRIDVAVTQVLDAIKAGKFEGGKAKVFTIKEDGVGLPAENPNLSSDINNKIKEVVESLHLGKEVTMNLDGEPFTLSEEHVLITIDSKEGFDVESHAGLFIILDTQLTDELIEEGFVREFISRIQQMRKANDYEMMDHIRIFYTATETLTKAIKNHAEFIKSETLADELVCEVKEGMKEETLARLTSKSQNKKGAKYRKEKREAVQERLSAEAKAERKESKILKLTEFVTVSELATMMNLPVTQVISTLMSVGIMVSINQRLDAETINLVADEFGFKTEYVSAEVQEAISEDVDEETDLVSRAPIVTVMGHVDHGKTSLLDHIRNTNVIAGEAGGITQHIGAYSVTLKNGRKVTFLDTPGHEAFTAMRARGTQVTDIAIIIIAADDSVMPTTKEAIAHAQAAGVPMVFAINKIDKPGANPDKIREDLSQMNLLVEEWGGKYQCQEISAKKGLGVADLLDKVLLEADMLDLKANPNRNATGTVIESSLDKGRGYVSTVLVSNGTLKIGDNIIAGTSWGRIKAMFNERNQRVEKAGPAEPVIILGLNGAPTAGDTFHIMETEQEARDIANKREQLQREQGLRTQTRLTLSDISHRIARGEFHEMNIIVKGDTDGSIEALSDSFIKLSTEKVKVNVISKAVGQISENDVMLAAASDAVIVGFQVRPSADARKLAERDGVEINTYSVIYDAIDDVTSAMVGMLDKVKKEIVTGQVEVQQVFKISKVGTVAGCVVTEGKVHSKDKGRVIRDGIVVHTAAISALKRYKDDVKEVVTGLECGISLVNYNDLQAGDMIETFTEIEVEQKL